MQVSGARTSTYDSRKMYEMLAKRTGKILYIHVHIYIYIYIPTHTHTHVECGFPHLCPFYGINAKLISFVQVTCLRTRSNKLNRFRKLLNWTSWKIMSIQWLRSLHCFFTSWTDKFRQCAKYSGRIPHVHCFAHGQWSASFFMRD